MWLFAIQFLSALPFRISSWELALWSRRCTPDIESGQRNPRAIYWCYRTIQEGTSVCTSIISCGLLPLGSVDTSSEVIRSAQYLQCLVEDSIETATSFSTLAIMTKEKPMPSRTFQRRQAKKRWCTKGSWYSLFYLALYTQILFDLSISWFRLPRYSKESLSSWSPISSGWRPPYSM